MAYSPQTWSNGSAGGTPLSAARLANMETGIDEAHALYEEGVGAVVSASVTTSETTTSTSYADLATVGPSVSVVVGASGKLRVTVCATLSNSAGGNFTAMSYALSGTAVRAASDNEALGNNDAPVITASMMSLLTGLTPGSYTVTAKYRTAAATGTFLRRRIIVEPI